MKKLIIFGLIFSSLSLVGQEFKDIVFDTTKVLDTIPRIELITKYDDGKMFLRWAPNQPNTWYNTLPFGYNIERYEMDVDKGIPKIESKIEMNVVPWDLARFEPYYAEKETHKFLLTMAECVHGELSGSGKGDGFTRPSQEIENKYGFALFSADMDFAAAEAGGLGYVDDRNIEEGKTYFYVVNSMYKDSTIMPGLSTVLVEKIDNPQPYISTAIEGEGKITLQWLRDDHEPFYSAYHIEKSTDGVTYQRVNENPFVGGVSKEFPSDVFSFTEYVENYKPAYYRIIGITPFSKESLPSADVRLMGRDRTPCPKVEDLSIMTDEQTKTVLLKWKPVECNDVKGYQIMKGSSPDGNFEEVGDLINPVLETEFRETVATTRNKIYYQVMTLDTAGNRSFTLPRLAAFRDTMPPAIPTGLTGSVDTNGIVTIQWNNNTEEDFRGYHIYRANAEYHMFTLVNSVPISKPKFVDTITLKTMTEEVFYKITSVDYQGHLSKFSEALRLTRPDTIRPFPPSITGYDQAMDHVFFDFTPSRSKDVVKHELFKKVNAGPWDKVEKFDVGEGSFTDYDVIPNNLYFYKIIAVDDADLESVDHATVRIKFVDKTLPEVVEINQCLFLDSTQVKIDWIQPNDKNSRNITVYRSINGGPMSVVHRSQKGNSYVDRIHPKRKYSYALKHVWKDGKKSKFSTTVHPQNQ